MTFEYRDDTGARLTVATSSTGISIWTKPEDVVVPQSRVEEVVAGIRDAARTSAGRPAQSLASLVDPTRLHLGGHAEQCPACIAQPEPPADFRCPGTNDEYRAELLRAARQTTGQADTEPDPAVVEAERVCALPDWAGCSCSHLTGCEHPHPAVGQPAEAQNADRAVCIEPARVRIINHPGVLATADTEIAALLDEHEAEHRAAVLREVAAMFEAEVDDCPAVAGCPPCDVRIAFAGRLRRMAGEARS